MKNGIELSAEIPRPLGRRIERHLSVFRPLIRGAGGSTWLFPSPSGGQRAMGSLSRVVAREVREATGAAFHTHMFRHIAADLLYDEDPGNGPVVQRPLGHTQLKTTETVYGVVKTRDAQRRWGEPLDRRVQQSRRAGKKPRGRK